MSDLVIPPGYGRLVGRVLRAVTVETGPAPLVGARVTVRPSVARVTRDGDPTPLIVGDAIECTLDDNGFLCGPDGELGVLLVATDADTRPAGWHWLVRVSAPSVVSYQWQVLVPEGVTTDMVAATSDPAVSGLPLLEWRGILTEVWEAHADVMSAVGAVDHDRQLAMAARAGVEQAAGRAETASSQAVTAQGAAEAAADTAETYANQAASSAQDAEALEASALAHKSAAASSAQAAEGGAQDAEAAAAAAASSAIDADRSRSEAASSATAAAGSAGSAFDDTAIAQGARLGAEAARDAAAGSATAAQTAAAALRDTGWRNIATLLGPSFVQAGALLQVRRTGDLVTLQATSIKPAEALVGTPNLNTIKVLDLPAGFGSAEYTSLGVAVVANTIRYIATLADLRVAHLYGAGLGGNWLATDRLMFTIVYPTKDPFPTTLPGTPA